MDLIRVRPGKAILSIKKHLRHVWKELRDVPPSSMVLKLRGKELADDVVNTRGFYDKHKLVLTLRDGKKEEVAEFDLQFRDDDELPVPDEHMALAFPPQKQWTTF